MKRMESQADKVRPLLNSLTIFPFALSLTLALHLKYLVIH